MLYDLTMRPDCIKWARGALEELWQKAAFYVPSLIVNRYGHGYLEKFELKLIGFFYALQGVI